MVDFATMVRWRVRNVAEAAGIKSANQLREMTGLSRSTIYPIWEGTAKRADLATLDRLSELLDVPVGQLLQRVTTKSVGGARPEPT
ncbi:MAG: helix-turn-helix domain-containing protein [Blastocatellia bacterium]